MSEPELPTVAPDPADEGRHAPGTDPLWSESWSFDFVTRDGSAAGYVRVGLSPHLGVVRYWAYLLRPDARHPLVAVVDHDVPLPPPAATLELRTEGLWADHIVETPLDHVTVGLEAFGVALDRPEEAYGNLWGERIALGFDLEWETDRDLTFACPARSPAERGRAKDQVAERPESTGGAERPSVEPVTTRYEISCTVHGEVLVGDERLDIDAIGQRHHAWGSRDPWAVGWCRVSGWLEDGTRFHASIRFPEPGRAIGYTAAPNGPAEATVACRVDDAPPGPHGFPPSATVTLDDLTLAATPIGWAPVLVTAEDGRTSRWARAAIRARADDGRRGVGWIEFNQPVPGPTPA